MCLDMGKTMRSGERKETGSRRPGWGNGGHYAAFLLSEKLPRGATSSTNLPLLPAVGGRGFLQAEEICEAPLQALIVLRTCPRERRSLLGILVHRYLTGNHPRSVTCS